MNWELILWIWTSVSVAWWAIAFVLVVTAKSQGRGAEPTDSRRITVFKPLPRLLDPKGFAHFDDCIESFVADLDANSELLIGCHLPDEPLLQDFVQRMRKRYPDADVNLVAHANPNRYTHPKVSWLHILARHATGELWLWSDSDIFAPPGTIRSLRTDFAATQARLVTSPYIINRGGNSAELLDALYVNMEHYPGVVLLDHLNQTRFALGAGMLFEAEDLRREVEWDVLGGCLSEDFYLGQTLGPVHVASMRLSTKPSVEDWPRAIGHYMRWQKTIRWCRPGAYAAQLSVLPILGWLSWLLLQPAHPTAWLGFLTVLAADGVAALQIARVLKCPIGWRRLHAIPLWSLMRGLSWLICWLPWPVVWRGRKWWSLHQKAADRPKLLKTERQPKLD